MFNEGIRTFTAYEDLEARRRVKIKSSTTKTPPEVGVCRCRRGLYRHNRICCFCRGSGGVQA